MSRSEVKGITTLDSSVLITSFPKSTEDSPTLLNYKNIVTLFHEFGHIMHHQCNEAKLPYYSGTNVEEDFVELPSKMLENWMKQEQIVKMISSHY